MPDISASSICCGQIEEDVGVDGAGGDDQAFGGDDLGAGADDDVHARHHILVAGLADGHDALALQADIGLDDAPVVEDQGIGDDAVAGLVFVRAVDALALAHAVADGLAAAELDFLAVNREIAFDFDDQFSVSKAHPVAGGRAEHFGIGATSYLGHVSCSRVGAAKTQGMVLPAGGPVGGRLTAAGCFWRSKGAPGQARTVELVALAGARRVFGFRGLVQGAL